MKIRTRRLIWFGGLLAVVAVFIALAVARHYNGEPQGNSSELAVAKPAYQTWRAVQMLAVRAYRSRFKDPGSIRAYLGSHSVRKLQLGAGGVDAEGWLNSDFEPTAGEIYLDVTEPFPLPDGCCSYVLAEHLIEHIPWESGVAMLKECHRVLAPGGKVRIVTPDLARLNQLLAGAQDADTERYLSAKLHLHQWQRNPVAGAYVLNMEHQSFGHQFLYDAATLRKSFELAGFTRVSEHRVSEKTDPVFQEAERRTRAPGSELWIVNDWEAMAVEAER